MIDIIVCYRYPTFVDALRDLDDALSMLFLFATMPITEKISLQVVEDCQRLTAEFQIYIMKSRSLRKVFFSIKGIYYQAEIKGQTITWLVPYQFAQAVRTDSTYNELRITTALIVQWFNRFPPMSISELCLLSWSSIVLLLDS